ncbi:hypothetical protein OROHE_002939 [Orobanche hederae]
MLLFRHLPRPRPAKAISTNTISESPVSGRNHHEFVPPSSYINSWKPSRNPKEAAAQLALLRRDYDRKVKQMRKVYIQEMELQRIEKLRKDEARKEALRIANEERKAAKDAKKKAEAIERQAAEEQFRQMLMREKAEKLEYWRMREKKIEEKKKEKNELVRRQSSLWVDERDLEKKIVNAVIDNTSLNEHFRLRK